MGGRPGTGWLCAVIWKKRNCGVRSSRCQEAIGLAGVVGLQRALWGGRGNTKMFCCGFTFGYEEQVRLLRFL